MAEKSPIHSIKDLKGKRLGIAGGELDKNWLLLQALAQKEQLDLNASVEKTFGAPPLINEQIKQNRVDAVLTYWHYAVRLEGQGYRQIIDGRGILKGLGITENVPGIGYVFKQSWAEKHKQAIDNFFKASKQAKTRLCTSDATWQKIIPLPMWMICPPKPYCVNVIVRAELSNGAKRNNKRRAVFIPYSAR